MKSIHLPLASLLLSITASALASWLVRRIMYVVQGGSSVPSDASVRVPVMVVPIVFVGNTIGSQVTVPRRQAARKFGRGRHRYQ